MNGDRDLVGGESEKPARLDYLEALVHQGCGVYGDLGPHLPGRVSKCLVDGSGLHLFKGCEPKRTPGCSKDEPFDFVILLAAQALVQCIMLAVDGKEFGA